MTKLESARARLAECEAVIAAGLGGPYAQKNLAAHRARVTRLGGSTPRLVKPEPIVTPVRLGAPQPATVQPTGTREERLRRLAAAMDASDAMLSAAIAGGIAPDAFALQCIEARDVETAARQILDA
jgi:nitroreductase